MVATCRELVRIPSESHQEREVAETLAERLREIGYDRVETDEHHNVVAWLEGKAERPSVILNGHTDHVPPQAMKDPFSAALVDASRWGEEGMAIYGRGTMDMKCNVVAAAYAGAAIKRAGIHLEGTYILTADVAEEIDSADGMPYILGRGITGDYGVSLESTRLQPYLGHRGKVEFELTVRGRTSHSSNPSEGDNAIHRAARLIDTLAALGPFGTHPLLGEGSLAILDISAGPGHGYAVVPDRCTIRIDRRFVPGETPESCRHELEEAVAALQHQDPSFHCEIEQVNLYPMMWIEPNHPLVKAVAAARVAALGEPVELGGWLFGVNATWMGEAGIPTVGFGPGDERYAHTPEEHILVSDLVSAAQVYALLILNLCGVDAAPGESRS
jgi:putative selenium metabolism hydrolase